MSKDAENLKLVPLFGRNNDMRVKLFIDELRNQFVLYKKVSIYRKSPMFENQYFKVPDPDKAVDAVHSEWTEFFTDVIVRLNFNSTTTDNDVLDIIKSNAGTAKPGSEKDFVQKLIKSLFQYFYGVGVDINSEVTWGNITRPKYNRDLSKLCTAYSDLTNILAGGMDGDDSGKTEFNYLYDNHQNKPIWTFVPVINIIEPVESVEVETENDFLDKDYDPNRKSLSLQRMIRDMRIRKNKNMLHMPKSENFPINKTKLDEWVSLQCNNDAKILAELFKSHTKYISWEQFYKKSKEVFELLSTYVGDKSYCIFTLEDLDGKFNKKSSYWMIQLMLDYFIETNKTNLPKELLLCGKNKCPDSNYDYYIVLDDCSYSGTQLFTEYLSVVPFVPSEKIIVVVPYISEYAFEKAYGNSSKFKDIFYGETMNYWWKDETVTLSSRTYDLNIEEDLNNILELFNKYFPNDHSAKIAKYNFMYYFDHKIADFASSFPVVYHTGIITPDGSTQPKVSQYTYNDDLTDSPACAQTTYLPFLDNCTNNKPTFKDVKYSTALVRPENLCVDTWYKRKYDNNQIDKKVLAFDFDDTLVNGNFLDTDTNTKPLDKIFENKLEFIEILNIAWKKLMPVYIISRRRKELLVSLLNRFYKEENIPVYLQIFKENILGRPKKIYYPTGVNTSYELREIFWADRKVKYLNYIIDLEKVNKTDILFCDDLQININKAKEDGFDNSIVINGKANAKQVIMEVNKFVPSLDYKQKYLKYKEKYLELKKSNHCRY